MRNTPRWKSRRRRKEWRGNEEVQEEACRNRSQTIHLGYFRMKRDYSNKGDDANNINVTIPMSVNLIRRLHREADRLGMTRTTLARNILEMNLPVESGEPRANQFEGV